MHVHPVQLEILGLIQVLILCFGRCQAPGNEKVTCDVYECVSDPVFGSYMRVMKFLRTSISMTSV